jgi:hypothetical protein
MCVSLASRGVSSFADALQVIAEVPAGFETGDGFQVSRAFDA